MSAAEQATRALSFQIVVAATKQLGIGMGGTMPWRLPADMAYFKRLTSVTADRSKMNAVVRKCIAAGAQLALPGQHACEALLYSREALQVLLWACARQQVSYRAALMAISGLRCCCPAEAACLACLCRTVGGQ